ncbi:MAG: CpXC domain-containing protein, partial [Rikenellaceae bacterium]
TLYHDMTHKFMILFSFDSDDVEDRYAPPNLPNDALLDNYTVRAVYGLMNFKEKIRMLESNLNDLAVEHMKYMISHLAEPEIAKKGDCLYFEQVDYEKTEEAKHGLIYFSYNDEEVEKIVTYRFSMDNYYEHFLTVKIDPRMELKGSKCVDAEWIGRQLKLAQ